MTPITFLHTSPLHKATFDRLATQMSVGNALVHHVHEDWLKVARKHGVRQGMIDDLSALIHAAPGPVVCTCTTLGEAAEALGAIRVDAPMMAKAAEVGGPILLAYALESTAQPSLDLLERALAVRGTKATVHPLSITEFWPLFEAGEHEAFVACVAGAVRHAATQTDLGCVVLAQASMAPAGPMLADIGVPILTSPAAALEFALTQV